MRGRIRAKSERNDELTEPSACSRAGARGSERLSLRLWSGRHAPSSAPPFAPRLSVQRHCDASPPALRAGTAPVAIPCSLVRASRLGKPRARRAAGVAFSADADRLHRHIARSCACALSPFRALAAGASPLRALPWKDRSRSPAPAIARRALRDGFCGSPHGRIHRLAWSAPCLRVSLSGPSRLSVSPAYPSPMQSRTIT